MKASVALLPSGTSTTSRHTPAAASSILTHTHTHSHTCSCILNAYSSMSREGWRSWGEPTAPAGSAPAAAKTMHEGGGAWVWIELVHSSGPAGSAPAAAKAMHEEGWSLCVDRADSTGTQQHAEWGACYDAIPTFERPLLQGPGGN